MVPPYHLLHDMCYSDVHLPVWSDQESLHQRYRHVSLNFIPDYENLRCIKSCSRNSKSSRRMGLETLRLSCSSSGSLCFNVFIVHICSFKPSEIHFRIHDIGLTYTKSPSQLFTQLLVPILVLLSVTIQLRGITSVISFRLQSNWSRDLTFGLSI